MKWFILVCLPLFVYNASHAQTNCNVSLTSNCNPTGAGSQCVITGESTINFTFESFGDFLTGGNVFGASILKMIVGENVAPLADCRWRLNVHMDNNGGAPTAWEQVYAYGANTSPLPDVNILEMRLRNQCNTSLTGSTYATLATTASNIDVVESPGVSNNSGTCSSTNVNRPGSYLNNFGEYSFAIDYRLKPTLNVQPGIYRLNVRYCITEGN
jgi:hypothetical protein